MKLSALIDALQSHNYILELRSPGFFNYDQYAARFDNWGGEPCNECGSPLPRLPYDSYEHANTFEEVIIEAAKEVIDLDKLDINLEDYE